MKVKAVVAKFTTSLDAGKVDLGEVARVWQLWWRHRLPAQAVASERSKASLEGFAEELKELAGATHVRQSETGGAEEHAYSLFQENSSVGTKTSAHLTGPEVMTVVRRLTCSLCSLRTVPQS